METKETREHLERYCRAFRKAGDAAKSLKFSDQTLSNYRSGRPKTNPGATVRERMRESGYDFDTGRLIIAIEPGQTKESVFEERGLRADSDIIKVIQAEVDQLPPIKEAIVEYDAELEELTDEEKRMIEVLEMFGITTAEELQIALKGVEEAKEARNQGIEVVLTEFAEYLATKKKN